jgi:hypothetical protein
MKRLEIKDGQVFGKLTIVSEAPISKLPSGQAVRSFNCKCECGTEKVIKLVHLTKGKTVSCGCKSITKGGEGGTHLCKLWRSLKYRTSETFIDRKAYFDKGITVCDEWKDNWENFKEWALNNGYDKKLQIDRIDNSKGYFPDNCKFVTLTENQRNRDCTFMVEFGMVKMPLMTYLEMHDLVDRYELAYHRIKRGWGGYRAVHTPPKEGKYKRK